MNDKQTNNQTNEQRERWTTIEKRRSSTIKQTKKCYKAHTKCFSPQKDDRKGQSNNIKRCDKVNNLIKVIE